MELRVSGWWKSITFASGRPLLLTRLRGTLVSSREPPASARRFTRQAGGIVGRALCLPRISYPRHWVGKAPPYDCLLGAEAHPSPSMPVRQIIDIQCALENRGVSLIYTSFSLTLTIQSSLTFNSDATHTYTFKAKGVSRRSTK